MAGRLLPSKQADLTDGGACWLTTGLSGRLSVRLAGWLSGCLPVLVKFAVAGWHVFCDLRDYLAVIVLVVFEQFAEARWLANWLLGWVDPDRLTGWLGDFLAKKLFVCLINRIAGSEAVLPWVWKCVVGCLVC